MFVKILIEQVIVAHHFHDARNALFMLVQVDEHVGGGVDDDQQGRDMVCNF